MIDQYHATIRTLSFQFPLLGLAMLHHRTTRDGPLVFRDKPHLVELYVDQDKIEDWRIRSAVQTGKSEFAIQLALYRAGWHGRICAYILPTYQVRDRFVQNRIDPPLSTVRAYRDRTVHDVVRAGRKRTRAQTGNLKTKRFGAGVLLFLGSNTSGDFIEFSADLLIIDEFDRCDPSYLPMALDRLRESPHPEMIRLGNPTLPGVGISKLYDLSDRRRFHHRCGHCGERQPIDWFASVVRRDDRSGEWVCRDGAAQQDRRAGVATTIRPVCRRCDMPFDRDGEGAAWVAEITSAAARGYWLTRLDVLTEDLWSLYTEWVHVQGDSVALAAFFCSVLGIPYEHAGARLVQEVLDAACTGPDLDWAGGEEYASQVVTAGVDVGAVLNVQVSVVEPVMDGEGKATGEAKRRTVWVGAFRTFGELIDALRRYHVDVCVIDAQPETHKAQEVRDEFISSGECQVWLCRFHPTVRVEQQKFGMALDYVAQECRVDRTAVFDVTFDEIRYLQHAYPADTRTVLAWSEQMRAPVRVLDEARQRIVWQEGSAPDHYRLTDVYDRIAFELLAAGGSYSAL